MKRTTPGCLSMLRPRALAVALLLAGLAPRLARAADGLGLIVEVQQRLGTPLVVGVAGPEAEHWLERQLRERPSLARSVAVVRVPTVGDPQAEMTRLMRERGVSCAVRVAEQGSTWAAQSFGDCAAGGAVPGPFDAVVAPMAGASSTAPSLTGPAGAVLVELMAMPDNTTRQALLTAKLGTVGTDADLAGRLGQALATVSALQSRGQGDPAVVEAYLRAALADDPATRAAAIAAASTGAPAPAVAVAPAGGAAASGTAGGERGWVCVWRSGTVVGSTIGTILVVDGESMGKLKAGGTVAVEKLVGTVPVQVQGENVLTVQVPIHADRTSVVEVKPMLGAMIARFSAQVVPLPTDRQVEDCRLAGAP